MKDRLLLGIIVMSILMLCFAAALSFDPISISDFSGGLNTADNVWIRSRTLNQADVCENWVLNAVTGSLSPRYGYGAVTDSLEGYNKIWGLHSHKFSTGQGILFQQLDRDDTCWCDLYISNAFSYDADDSIGSYLYPRTPNWVSWLDNTYFFNGMNIPKIITGLPENPKMMDIIPASPSEPNMIPLATPASCYGEFIYGVVWADSSIVCGNPQNWKINYRGCYRSPEIFLDSNALMIMDIAAISGNEWGSGPAYVKVIGFVKTRPNRTDIQKDSLFLIDEICNIHNNSEVTAISFIDTSLGNFTASDYVCRIKDLNPGYIASAFGKMAELNSDTGTINHNRWVISGGPEQQYCRYVCCFLDTLTLTYSDTNICSSTISENDTLFNITLWIPPVRDDNYVRVIYRDVSDVNYNWLGYYCVDTVVNPNDTIFFDTLQYDSIMLYNYPLDFSVFRTRWKGAIIHDDRMFAWDDHYMYVSETGTGGQWGLYDIIEFDLDDGDRIVNLRSHEGYVIPYKTKSIYVVYTEDGYVTYRSKKSSGVGMIASNSLVNYNGANLFLDMNGVKMETANIYQERSLKRESYSRNIDNVLCRPVDQMVGAAGAVMKDCLLMSYPGTDSTFVLFFETEAWSTWTFDFMCAVSYDTLKRSQYTPFGELVFVKDDDERIFLLHDTMTTDDGQDYQATWAKTFAFRTPQRLIPEEIHLWRTIQGQQTDTVYLTITNGNNDTLAQLAFDSLYSSDPGEGVHYVLDYRYIASLDNMSGHYLRLEMIAPNKKLQIDGLDFFVRPAGKAKSRGE